MAMLLCWRSMACWFCLVMIGVGHWPRATGLELRNHNVDLLPYEIKDFLNETSMHMFSINKRTNVSEQLPFLSISIRTNANGSLPIFLSARGGSKSTDWKVPQTTQDLGSDSERFSHEARTICMNGSTVTLQLSTFSQESAQYTLRIAPVEHYTVKMGDQRNEEIGPLERKLFYFEMLDSQDGIIVKLTSNDEMCAIVTLDSATCMDSYQEPLPRKYLDHDTKKITQTMTKKSTITVYRKHFPLFHIIVFVPQSNESCTDYGNPRVEKIAGLNRGLQVGTKNVTISIGSVKLESYFAILWYPLIVVGMASAVLVVCICPPLAAYMEYPERPIYERPKLVKVKKPEMPDAVKGSFLFSLMVIAAFYSLPALQLLYHHQRLYRVTGNQDICYYNFLCLRPLGSVMAFNNIYSNLSYVIFGLTFLLMVRVHSRRLAWRYREIFYSMGMALTLEGFLSAGYHICPTAHNFQFDTTFMYIISGLCIYHLYQIRNPHQTGHPYKFYGIFAGAGVYVVMGIFSSELGWRVSVTVAYGITAILVGAIVMNKLYIQNVEAKSHKTAQRVMGGIQTFLTLLLIAYSLYCLIEDPDSFPSVLLNIFIGNLFFFTIFYFALKIANQEALVAGSILCTALALASWAASFYFYTGWRSTNWQLAPSGSRSLNADCVFLDFFDSHDVWHLLSSFSLFVSFILLLTLDDGLAFGAGMVNSGMSDASRAMTTSLDAASSTEPDLAVPMTLRKDTLVTSLTSEGSDPKVYRCYIDE